MTLAPRTGRKPTSGPIAGVLSAIKPARGNLHEVDVTLDAGAAGFRPSGVARLRPE